MNKTIRSQSGDAIFIPTFLYIRKFVNDYSIMVETHSGNCIIVATYKTYDKAMYVMDIIDKYLSTKGSGYRYQLPTDEDVTRRMAEDALYA